MYTKPVLGLEQCQAAINAMVAEFNKDTSRRPIDMAIVDDNGGLLAYARMDGCVRPTFAQRKAHTAAVRRADTGALAAQLSGVGINLADFGDPMLIALGGGVPVINPSDGVLIGGIGVGGLPTGQADEDIARVGLKALNL